MALYKSCAHRWILITLILVLKAGLGYSAPSYVDYQGRLADALGNPVDGVVSSMVFRIWSAPKGGSVVWVETQSVVQVESGLFHVSLGSVAPFPSDLFDVDGRTLSIQVNDDPQMAPRIPILSVPYALNAAKAVEADTATFATTADTAATATQAASATFATTAGSAPADDDWAYSGANIYRSTGNVGIGTAAPATPLHVHKASGNLATTFSATAGDSVLQVSGSNDATIDFQKSGISEGQMGYDSGTDSLFMFNGGWVVLKNGNLGVGTTDPKVRLHVDAGSARIGGSLDVGNNLGVGTTNPLAKMHVEGTLRVDQRIMADDAGGLEFATSDGTIRMQLTDSGRIGIGTANPSDLLHVYKATGNLAPKLQAWSGDVDLILDAATGNPTVEFQENGAFGGSVGYDTANNYMFLYQGGAVVVKDGNLGIGTTSPTNDLEVNGTVKVTGACYGTFPRPAYDSGWVTMNQNEIKVLTHDVGGNVDNYVVDIMSKDLTQGGGINNRDIGGDSTGEGAYDKFYGFYYRSLDASQVKINRKIDDLSSDQIRLRIWVYQ